MITASETQDTRSGRSLAELRKAQGLTVPELARQIGVTDQSIRLWEAGRVRPRPKAYAQLLRVLQVRKDELALTPYIHEGEVLEARRRAGRARWEKYRKDRQDETNNEKAVSL